MCRWGNFYKTLLGNKPSGIVSGNVTYDGIGIVHEQTGVKLV